MQKIEKVVLIEPRSRIIDFFSIARMPLLGLPILGAILQKMKLRVKIFCERLTPINWQEVAQADLVGISILTNLAPRAYEIVDKVRGIAKEVKRKIFIVMGGPHVSFLPEEALKKLGKGLGKRADFVVRHEGEDTLKELVEYLQGTGTKNLEEIAGLSYWDGEEIKHNPDRPFIEDLDQIPLPDFSLIEGKERINIAPLQTSRGCPYNCKYCSVIRMFGRKIRYRSPESVIGETKKTLRNLGRKHLFAVDDNFSDNKKRVLNLLGAIRKANLALDWSTQDRVEVAWKPEILQLMRETGCVRLYQGIESFNPDALKEWSKGQTPEEIEEAISIIHKHRLLIHGMFILGADTDTQDTINYTIDSTLRCGLDTAQFFALVPPPGTELYKELKAAGRIFERDWSRYDGQCVVFRPKQMSPWNLQKLIIKGPEKFYTYRRGVKWAFKRKFRNSAFAFAGPRLLKQWLKENEGHLAYLERKWAA